MTTPTIPQLTLDGLTLLFRINAGPAPVDVNGVEWLLTKLDGWTGVPAPRVARTDKPGHPGSFRAPNYRGPRIINMEFTATAPDGPTMRAAEQQVAAVCSDPGKLYPLILTEGSLSQQVMVELDDATLGTMVLLNQTTFSMRVAAPDPRKHDVNWQTPVANMGTPPSGGLSFTGGASFVPSADFGTVGVPSAATVRNLGTANARPIFTVTGPLAANWKILDVGSGVSLSFAGALGSGDIVTINTDDFPANGFPGHGVYLNTQINRRPLLLAPSGWPRVAPGASATYILISAGFTAATLTVSLRSAWH